MLKKAAQDPDVISIKMTLYRMARESQIVQALMEAAENGKEVVALVELRARFDEQNNIDWSKQLEEAGCTILYGFDDYKVHSKLTLITKKGPQGYSYITQIGTGNYNEKPVNSIRITRSLRQTRRSVKKPPMSSRILPFRS